jgi:hypothetical protein
LQSERLTKHATVSALERIETLLAIANIRAAELPHPYSQISSGFLSDLMAMGEIVGADLLA